MKLTGMTWDFNCMVAGNRCTNHGGTADDSWSGTLDAGDHKIVVYTDTGASGGYSLIVTAETPSTGGSTGTNTEVTTPVDVSETGVSSRRKYNFHLSGSAEVNVALTGMTRDFDCRVGNKRCTNRWRTADDSWSGTLDAGDHTVSVYPYGRGGAGDYSLKVTVTRTLGMVANPMAGGPAGPKGVVCKADDEGNPIPETCKKIVFTDSTTADDNTGDDGPPPGTGPGEGTPGTEDGGGGDGGGGGGGGGGGDSQGNSRDLDGDGVADNYLAVVAETTACSNNLSPRQRFGAPRPGGGTHTGADIDVADGSEFFAFKGGELTNGYNARCGNYVDIVHDGGGSRVCHLDPNHLVADGRVDAGGLIGRWGGTGTHSGGAHLHLSYTDANGVQKPYYEDTDGEPTLNDDGC